MSEKQKKTTEKVAKEESVAATVDVSKGRAKIKPIVRQKNSKAVFLEEIRLDENGGIRENPYYLKIASNYALIKYLALVLGLIFTITMLTAFSTDITAENFQYLLKDLDISGVSSGGVFDSLVYNGASDSSFGLYRGEMVVVSSGTVQLYKPSGALSLNQANNYYAPSLLVSDKYFIVYDRGETSCSYSVFNSFAQLFSEQLAYPITSAAISNEGSYALLTRSDISRGVVRVYDRDFALRCVIEKDKYVVSADFTDDGRYLTLASVYDKDGDYVTELVTVDLAPKEPTVVKEATVAGRMPLRVEYLDNGHLALTCTTDIAVYNEDLLLLESLPYLSRNDLRVNTDKSHLVTVYNNTVLGYDKTVNIYDVNGQQLYTGTHTGELIAIRQNKNYVALLFFDRLVRIDAASGQVLEAPVEPNAVSCLFVQDRLVVCYSGHAVEMEFTEENRP